VESYDSHRSILVAEKSILRVSSDAKGYREWVRGCMVRDGCLVGERARETVIDLKCETVRATGGPITLMPEGMLGLVGTLSLTVLIEIQLLSLRSKTESGAIRCDFDE
jgi:hypothetical protein